MDLQTTSGFPAVRLRRLRKFPALRAMVRETHLNVKQLILPFFVRPGRKLRQEIGSMPGIFQLSVDELIKEIDHSYQLGISAVLLFGIPKNKDTQATEAYAKDGIIQKAVIGIKKHFPDLIVITDVCLCEYMSHGHCGIVKKIGTRAQILNDPSLKLLTKSAVSHADSGADIVAPSDMMDGRVKAIRKGLDAAGFTEIPILSYAAKYASAFYGPFREAAESAPQFGDRRSYQMDPANSNEALREVALDIQEGADMVMVKPALSYLDILCKIKEKFGLPTAAYAVSGEYSMIKAAAQKNWIDERAVTMESMISMRRAGADMIITYSANQIAKWLDS